MTAANHQVMRRRACNQHKLASATFLELKISSTDITTISRNTG